MVYRMLPDDVGTKKVRGEYAWAMSAIWTLFTASAFYSTD